MLFGLHDRRGARAIGKREKRARESPARGREETDDAVANVQGNRSVGRRRVQRHRGEARSSEIEWDGCEILVRGEYRDEKVD